MRLYISATMRRQEAMREIRLRVHRDTPHRVVSTWLDQQGSLAAQNPSPHESRLVAKRDIEDLHRSDMLLLDGGPPNGLASPTGGKHFEHGFMVGIGRVIAVVGSRESVFSFIADYHFETWDEAITWLGSKN